MDYKEHCKIVDYYRGLIQEINQDHKKVISDHRAIIRELNETIVDNEVQIIDLSRKASIGAMLEDLETTLRDDYTAYSHTLETTKIKREDVLLTLENIDDQVAKIINRFRGTEEQQDE